MSGFVLDSSVALTWCFRDEATDATDLLQERLRGETALVPRVLWDLEVWNALLVAARRGRVRSLSDNLRHLMGLPVRRMRPPLEDALELAFEHTLSSFDAFYLALAVRAGLPLATLDAALASAASSEGVDVLPS